ncbi:hypothetical protein [Cohnella candidum]|uniref:Uncharacterized protein n=1 Tax=Cohnella candidum TaxID=2674991 RepID=A0A3G3JW88_9BACL|nr:hypothetical protein [Cohnella candidum]AYQ72117.1 hypothetical protein EAV92_05745 [Cohnella candidum]
MIQNQSTYHIEKMIQHRQTEMDRNIRRGLYLKTIVADQAVSSDPKAGAERGFWHKWFGSKRLHTS